MRPAVDERLPVGHMSLCDCIDGRIGADAEAVEDDEDDRTGAIVFDRPRTILVAADRGSGRHACLPSAWARALAVTAALATMPAISSGLSEAPPTSPPSIECSAKNSPMLALVTLPP